MKRIFVIGAACVMTLVVLGAPALAHGHRAQGDMEFTVGWANEPAFAGQVNAVQLHLEHDGQPVEGAEDALKVTVAIGDRTTDPLKLEPAFDSPGEYRAPLIPTVVGGYTFHFTGTVDGEKVDQSFTAPKDGFDEVEGTSEIAFPKKAPSTTELDEALASVRTEAREAKDAIALPQWIAIIGVVLGALALMVTLLRPRSAS
jgi:hypothetical protein